MDTNETKRNINPDHYAGKYDSKRRFISYWHQINEVLSLKPKNLLEIGVGNGFTSRYLREQGVDLTTCDLEDNLNPDYVASVTKLPFKDGSFDVVMACEILEHMPYKDSVQGLREIYRVTSRAAVISVPDATRVARIEFPIPKYGKVRKLLTLPKRHPLVHTLTKDGHHWELGKQDYPAARFIQDIQKVGFSLENEYRVFENPYHHFFILKK